MTMFGSSIDFLTQKAKDITQTNRRSIDRIASGGYSQKLAAMDRKTGTLGRVIRITADNMSKQDSIRFFQNAISFIKFQEDAIMYAHDLYTEMASLAQKAQSTDLSNSERIDLNNSFISFREQALELNNLTFNNKTLFDEMAGSIKYDISFGSELIRSSGNDPIVMSEEKDVIYNRGTLTIDVNSGTAPERYRVYQNNDLIFDTGWWLTKNSASTFDFDRFVIDYGYGKDTSFEFVPLSAGDSTSGWLNKGFTPNPDDKTYDNKVFTFNRGKSTSGYLKQLALEDMADDSPSGLESLNGLKYPLDDSNSQGQVLTGRSNSSDTMLKVQVETDPDNPTIYQIVGSLKLPDITPNTDVGNVGDLPTFMEPLGLGMLRRSSEEEMQQWKNGEIESYSGENGEFPTLKINDPTEAKLASMALENEMIGLEQQMGILGNNMSRVLTSMEAVDKQLGIQRDLIAAEPEQVVLQELENLSEAREMRSFNASLMNKVVQMNHDMVKLLLM